MSLSKKCELCINFLKSKGIISKTVKSYVLTNKQKEDLSYKSLEWTIKNKFSEDYDIVLECVKIIVKENKCEKDVLEKMLKIKKQDKIVKKGCLGIKCESDKICNPVTGRCVKKDGKLGKTISGKKSKGPTVLKIKCPENKIINPATGKCVAKDSKIGKQIQTQLKGKSKKESSSIEKWLNKMGVSENYREISNLDLSDKKLKTLPEDISRLKKLEHLDLSNNNIKTLPNSISKLELLSFLILSGNPIKRTEVFDKLESRGVTIIF